MYNHVVYSLAKSGSNGLTLDIANENPQCTMLHSYFSKRWHINDDWNRLTVNYHKKDDYQPPTNNMLNLDYNENIKLTKIRDQQTAIKLDSLKQFSKNNNFISTLNGR